MSKRRNGFKSLILAAVLCCTFGLAAACSDGAGTPKEFNATIKTVASTVKVMQNDEISSFADGKVAIEAAKGETEGGQILINCDKDIDEFDVTVSSLTSASGKTIDSSAIDVYAQAYISVTVAYTGNPSGFYPDALIPMEYVKKAKENNFKRGNNQGIWFDVNVPRDAEAGEYNGNVTVKLDNKTFNVPMSVSVFDFTMPQAPAVRSTYLIWRDWLIDGELDNTPEKYNDYYDMLLRYNVVPYDFPNEQEDIEGFVANLRKYYNKVNAYGIPYKFTQKATSWSNGERVPVLDDAYLKDILQAVADASAEDGVNYFEKAYYYFDKIYDEIKEANYPQLFHAIETTNDVEAEIVSENGLTGEIAQSVQNRRHLISTVEGWNEDLEEIADDIMLSPIYNNFSATDDINLYRDLIEEGMWVESYGAASFWPYGAHLIDDYMITARDVFWSKYDYGLSGDLFWCVNAYCNFGSVLVSGYARLEDLYRQSMRDGVTGGDGFMVYPGRLYGSEEPFPSLRLTATRDGIDDYAYFALLEEVYKKLAAEYGVSDDNVKDTIAMLHNEVYAVGVSKLNFEGLLTARQRIARLIELANSDAKLFLNVLSAGEQDVSYEFYASADTGVTVNGENAEGTACTNGKKYTGNTQYSGKEWKLGLSGTVTEEISFHTGRASETVFDFDTQGTAEDFIAATAYGNSVVLDTQYARSGNAAKITLTGHIFENDLQTKSYRPQVSFEMSNLDKTEKISFWVYNAQATPVTITIFMENTAGINYDVDKITLQSGEWKMITVENFTYASATAQGLAKIKYMGISTENLINGDDVYSVSLYVDDVRRAMK